MKKNFTRFATAFALAITTLSASAQVTENFNTRPNGMSGTDIRDLLIAQGWRFSNTTVQTFSGAVIEGDGLLQTGSLGSANTPQGITTPIIKPDGSSITISFKYKFNATGPQQRTLHILLTDCQGNLVSTLVSNSIPNSTTLVNFSNSYTIPSGQYKIQIGFTGSGGVSSAQIDALSIQNASLCYPNGVNSAPVGTTDNFNGTNLRTASGNVLLNDTDANNDPLEVQLLSGPAANVGTLTLNSNGDFEFTPATGYAGPGFVFEYMVCENTCEQLCGAPVTAIVNFPGGAATPVMMLSFTGTLSAKTVTLNWSTATELNNAKFEILRSEDGASFSKVGEVDGRGTVTSITNYTWKENVSAVSAPVLHYKLKQLDSDGKYEFSKTVVVRLNADAAVIASVAPNPVVGTANLTVNLQRNANVQVRLLNNMGKELARKNFNGQTGSNAFPLYETNDLVRGIYLLEVVIDNKERTLLKIVK